MLALAELQTCIRNAVLGASADPLKGVVADDRLGHARRLNVYRNNTTILLREALAENFPVTAQLVGGDFFAHLSRAFVRTHPPQSPCLFEYGERLADFIETCPEAQGLPYLADVARLEWMRIEALYATDAMTLDPTALARIDSADYGRLSFTLHPAAHVAVSPYPIHSIWLMHQPGADPYGSVDLHLGGETVLVTRPDAKIRITALHSGEDIFIHTIRQGAPLETAYLSAQAHTPAFDATHALTTLLLSGALSGYLLI